MSGAAVAGVASLPDLATVATPALVVDRAVLVDNVERMAARAGSAGVALRPHVKTHKSLEVAALQRARGAAGLTVATLREAEVFVAAGFDDILIASPPIGVWRLDRLVEVARQARVRVVVDDADGVGLLEQACRRAGVSIG
jgi:D-serine deaminase-like pyridoxal phosphate-dependent protein